MNSGFLLINKPAGPTSHDIVNILRRITGIKKIGHAGTLDPFASGLLIVAVGREATRKISQYVKMDKEYLAAIRLGALSDTYDRTGRITLQSCKKISAKKIKDCLGLFTGEVEQIPPMFSAKKIKGKKLYELARIGQEAERQPSRVTIKKIKIIGYEWPHLKIKVECSSGTYIRSLANDLGSQLGSGAYLEELSRTKIGVFNLKNAFSLDELDKDNWQEFLFR